MTASNGITAIQTLLVPLDGSALAEAALPHARALALRLGARIVLLHVLEHDAPAEVHGEPHLTTVAAATEYMERVTAHIGGDGLAIEFHVHPNPERNVSANIVAHADELGIDLIVLANHGYGGLRGLLFGRVAQHVVQRGSQPVLAIPARSGARNEPPPAYDRIALLLNRSAEAETALPIAEYLARALPASLHLIFAVPTTRTLDSSRSATAKLLPRAAKVMLELEEREAHAYLDGIAAGLGLTGVEIATTVTRGAPASATIDAAERDHARLLVLSTHGRGGLGGIWSESVGAKILSRSSLPLLLIPAGR